MYASQPIFLPLLLVQPVLSEYMLPLRCHKGTGSFVRWIVCIIAYICSNINAIVKYNTFLKTVNPNETVTSHSPQLLDYRLNRRFFLPDLCSTVAAK